MLDISIVIPLYNERESLEELTGQLAGVLKRVAERYEILFIDDGSSDGSFEKLVELKGVYPEIKVIKFRRNYGKSAALSEGFKRAVGKIIITMDADLQDDPQEIPNLLKEIESGYDLVSGWKKKRYDSLGKTVPSKIFNLVTAWITGIKIHDFNCGLKAYRREVTQDIKIYGELHRFLPVLAKWEGYRVGETAVRHHPRKYGVSKFGMKRFTSGLFDLITVLFITKYNRKPLHLFGIAGMLTSLVGTGILIYLTIVKLMGHSIGQRPLLFLGILLAIIGVQFISVGLLGEMISYSSIEDNYSIERIVE